MKLAKLEAEEDMHAVAKAAPTGGRLVLNINFSKIYHLINIFQGNTGCLERKIARIAKCWTVKKSWETRTLNIIHAIELTILFVKCLQNVNDFVRNPYQKHFIGAILNLRLKAFTKFFDHMNFYHTLFNLNKLFTIFIQKKPSFFIQKHSWFRGVGERWIIV